MADTLIWLFEIEVLKKKLKYFMARCSLWKRKAKELRKIANEMPSVQEFMYYKMRTGKAEVTATRRLELLRRQNTIRFNRGKQCFICDRYPILNHKIGSEYEKVYIDNHAEDCELARGLGDETR